VEVTEVNRSYKLDFLVHRPYSIVEKSGLTFRLQVGKP
jgi:hypothetical protein